MRLYMSRKSSARLHAAAVAAVHVIHPHHFLPETAQRVVHLARVVRRHVRILRAGDQHQRRRDAIGEHDRRVLHVLLRLLPQRCADAILLALGGGDVSDAEARAVGVEADDVDLARDVDRGLEAIRSA